MKLDKACKIESASEGKKGLRLQLRDAYLDVEKNRVLATDGYVAAIVPVEIEAGDTSGYIPTEALTQARKATAKKADAIALMCNGSVTLPDNRTFPRENLGTFPNVDLVIPKPETRNFTTGLDVKLLVKLADALGTDYLDLSYDTTSPYGPILVTPHSKQGTGVLMPRKK